MRLYVEQVEFSLKLMKTVWPKMDIHTRVEFADAFEIKNWQNVSITRAGSTIVPFMPWHRALRCQGAPSGRRLNFSYHITFYNYGSIRVWRSIGLFYQNAPVLKSTGHFFYKRGPLIQGHKIGCPRLENLLNFALRYGYSLWYDVIFIDNINVLDLALWAEKILKLNVFLCNLKKNTAYTVVSWFSRKLVKLVPP